MYAMNVRTIGHRLFTDGTTRPVYQDERGQFIEDDDGRVDDWCPFSNPWDLGYSFGWPLSSAGQPPKAHIDRLQ